MSAAKVAGLVIADWPDIEVIERCIFTRHDIDPYVSGEFYRRELPRISELLGLLGTRPDIISIDGYVDVQGVEQVPP